ncbi:MAG: sigma-70 family RNA polymerase sigma factor [Acidobacteriaceae bacterium]
MATAHPISVEETDRLQERERATASDEEFSLLVYRQHRFVFRVAFALLRNAQDAEDIAQETFLKLYRNGRWRDIRDERAFLARTAWRLALDLRRAPAMAVADVDADVTPSQTASPEQQALSADSQAALHRLIDALPEELRQPLALAGIDEMTSREIGAALGLPEGTVRTRLMRARQLLKEKIANAKEGAYAG